MKNEYPLLKIDTQFQWHFVLRKFFTVKIFLTPMAQVHQAWTPPLTVKIFQPLNVWPFFPLPESYLIVHSLIPTYLFAPAIPH